jgi:hypothetical protein
MVCTLPKVFRDPSVYTSSGLETVSLVTGTSHLPFPQGAGLLQLFAYNSGSAGFVQVWDGYASPTDGYLDQSLLLSYPIASSGAVSLEFTTSNWLPVTVGIVVVLSSTVSTYTALSSSLFCTALWTTR